MHSDLILIHIVLDSVSHKAFLHRRVVHHLTAPECNKYMVKGTTLVFLIIKAHPAVCLIGSVGTRTVGIAGGIGLDSSARVLRWLHCRLRKQVVEGINVLISPVQVNTNTELCSS